MTGIESPAVRGFRVQARIAVLHDALLPAQLQDGVDARSEQSARVARVAFQAATADEFTEAIEQIVYRKVQAFASGVDPDANVVFETFYFEPQAPESEGNGHGGPGEIH
jgi:hypothetical protein